MVELRKRPNEDDVAAAQPSKRVAVDKGNKPTKAAATEKHAAISPAQTAFAAAQKAARDAIAALPAGSVFTVGEGDAGQLGLGEEITSRKKPTPLRSIENVPIVRMAAGGVHTVAITAKGQVYSWGCNDEGALGRSGEEAEPALVKGLIENEFIVAVTCGDSHTNVLSDKGVVYGWGTYRDSAGRMGFDFDTLFKEGGADKATVQFEPKVVLDYTAKHDRVVRISASNNHTIALTEKGNIVTWGCGEHGQLGRVGSRMSDRSKHLHMLGPAPVLIRRKKAAPKDVFTGGFQSFVLFDDDTVVAFGLNNYYQCGIPDVADPIYAPTEVPALSGRQVVSIKGGEHHTLALLADGSVLSFGRGDYGRLGHGNNNELSQPVKIDSLGPSDQVHIDKIATGGIVSYALSNHGEVYAWGMGSNYQLALGPDDDMDTPTLVPAPRFGDNSVLDVVSGGQHTVFLVNYKNKIVAAGASAAPSVSATPMQA
ncbi:Rcc1 protein [Capsaspora owczarzaki ATCC 30864]|uniref:Rcc1 protein n=1 Tax=Capsaspora owczarzaki (strain ATCC 30864) TaxID=595528 RepID=A0A0D2X357_CAPO3|nr:Rcc1 protein [Capsaspora owczarzaki ATCC 30864]KJE93729.1 Rcc1 protein [Capsaspora owczarzaki ATCC 30864]|eukprot:XP_004348307.1 Rcc1 protein [Capsaspora owczarzaki ATCC 30864]